MAGGRGGDLGGELAAAVEQRTQSLNNLSASNADAQSRQLAFGQRDTLDAIRLETSLIGESAAVRERELALLKERQAIAGAGGDVNSDASRNRLANVEAITAETRALRQQ